MPRITIESPFISLDNDGIRQCGQFLTGLSLHTGEIGFMKNRCRKNAFRRIKGLLGMIKILLESTKLRSI